MSNITTNKITTINNFKCPKNSKELMSADALTKGKIKQMNEDQLTNMFIEIYKNDNIQIKNDDALVFSIMNIFISIGINLDVNMIMNIAKKLKNSFKPTMVDIAVKIAENMNVFSITPEKSFAYVDNVYKTISNESCKIAIYNEIDKAVIGTELDDEDKKDKIFKNIIGKGRSRLAKYNEVNNTKLDPNCFDNSDYIILNNGAFNLRTGVLVQASPNILTRRKLNCNYNLNWKKDFYKSKFYSKLLKDSLVDDDKINLMQEVFGMILKPEMDKIKKIIVLQSRKGNNGKSVFMSIIRNLIGDESLIGSVGLNGFNDKFAAFGLYGKMLNLVDDDECQMLQSTGILKSISSGMQVRLEQKGKDAFTSVINCAHILGINSLPNSISKDKAFADRFLQIKFEVEFIDEDDIDKPKYQDKTKYKLKDKDLLKNILDNEMDIIFGWAYEGYLRLVKNKFKFSKCISSEIANEEYAGRINKAKAFLDEQTYANDDEVNIQSKIGIRRLYRIYLMWCKERGIKEMPSMDIFKENIEQYGEVVFATDKNGKKARWSDTGDKDSKYPNGYKNNYLLNFRIRKDLLKAYNPLDWEDK